MPKLPLISRTDPKRHADRDPKPSDKPVLGTVGGAWEHEPSTPPGRRGEKEQAQRDQSKTLEMGVVLRDVANSIELRHGRASFHKASHHDEPTVNGYFALQTSHSRWHFADG